MSDAIEQLRVRADDDGIEFFFAMFVDMHGKPCAKLIPATSIDVMMGGGAGLPALRPDQWANPPPIPT